MFWILSWRCCLHLHRPFNCPCPVRMSVGSCLTKKGILSKPWYAPPKQGGLSQPENKPWSNKSREEMSNQTFSGLSEVQRQATGRAGPKVGRSRSRGRDPRDQIEELEDGILRGIGSTGTGVWWAIRGSGVRLAVKRGGTPKWLALVNGNKDELPAVRFLNS